ncbi:MAG: DUF4430 domain-containing protein [Miltoncostaeaceae bacterium]
MSSAPPPVRPSLARRALAAALIVILALLAGCERRAQEEPAPAAPSAALRITDGHGATTLLDTRIAPGQSMMRGLRGAAQVRTEYGGGFVAEMFGRVSDAGAQRDWFVFVNGILSPVGARQVRLADGDAVWWDFREWGALSDAWAVVGDWPAPFTRPAPRVHADPPLAESLAAAGAEVVDDPGAPWRVRVGASEDLAGSDPAWARAVADPHLAGLTMRISGGDVESLDPAEGTWHAVPGARALVAAVPTGDFPEDGVAMFVAGLDAGSARAAADAIAGDPALLLGAYALAFDGEGAVLAAGGRAGDG